MALPDEHHTDATIDYVVPVEHDLGQTQEIANDTKPLPLADSHPNLRPVQAVPKQIIKLTQLGDFRLVAKLGQGGMGSVYKAEQVTRKRFVALKVMNREYTTKPGYVARFHREIRAMGRLDHPNLIKCLSAGESHGFLYFAMEIVDGGCLGDWKKKLGSLIVADAVSLTLGIAKGLQHAHEAGLIHRDIKPDNILLTKTGVPKISDLGLAKTLDDESGQGLTQTGIGIGTPLYAPLEQIKDAKTADARADIFALGCLFYELLVGRPPFEAESLLGMIKAKEKGTYSFASTAKAGVPQALDRILLKCLAKSPDGRYSTCAELIEELELLNLASESLSFLPAMA